MVGTNSSAKGDWPRSAGDGQKQSGERSTVLSAAQWREKLVRELELVEPFRPVQTPCIACGFDDIWEGDPTTEYGRSLCRCSVAIVFPPVEELALEL